MLTTKEMLIMFKVLQPLKIVPKTRETAKNIRSVQSFWGDGEGLKTKLNPPDNFIF